MINAAFHVLAWGLVIALVWSSWFREPAPVEPPFRAVAQLDGGYYLIGAQSDATPQFGLLKYDQQGLGFRRLLLEDWDQQLTGELRALCAVPGYAGEVIALLGLADQRSRLVHLQIRRWSGNPKSAILSAVDIDRGNEWRSMACGEANQQWMAIALSGPGADGAAELRGRLQFEPLALADTRVVDSAEAVPSALYRAADGVWRSYPTATGSRITFTPTKGVELPAYRVDGFSIVGLAAGAKPDEVSFIAADEGMGNLWRPLGPFPQAADGSAK
ncbi:hypothetical protein [Simiduia agarivorans]|uniref:Uncharacterized protein n=1 Tax=Simiduia agarivorans (strain DSM 21679 / JCM 13881 / BCRC 17597 / SA1) TaxID=1117647 RepID=K4KNJ6_SIMAS|nr:hypothetical protein [Simiduia agarivorans]AFV00617.1 hypothetical protein M5M_17440 [Simiduia agarivorans SA1 = DSM 21679]